MAEWSKAAVSKTAKMVTSSRVRILPGLLKELDYCVMVSTSDFGSDSLGSNPGSPANVGVTEWFRWRSAKPLTQVRILSPTLNSGAYRQYGSGKEVLLCFLPELNAPVV